MSAFHCTPSLNDTATTKVKDPQQHMEEDWMLISEAKLDPVLSNDKVVKKAWEEAERQAEEACKAQEEVVKKEREEREASCSWLKKTAGEAQKQKWVQQLEEADNVKVVKEGDDEEEEVQSHFMVLPHLAEDHWDALVVLTTTLDVLSMDFLAFQQDSWNLGMSMLRALDAIADELWRLNDLKEEEMGKAKGKGKEKAKEEGPRRRAEDDNGDMEMGRAGPSSLV
ncbi:hypothetical protein ID866_9251 [Astraeus odoratus]|nr:hypothetical protein ID866_9251 [Astraeus odoratus]